MGEAGGVSRRAVTLHVLLISNVDIMDAMKKSHQKTLELIFTRPVPGSIRWRDIESLLTALGAEFEEREGSRVAVIWNGQVKVFHRPHPSPDTDKGAVVSVKKWLEEHKVNP